MKKVFLLTLISLTGCETYIPAQDVYYDASPAVVYTQPVAVYEQPEVTYIQQSATPQTVYISQQPATSVIYVEEPVYYVQPQCLLLGLDRRIILDIGRLIALTLQLCSLFRIRRTICARLIKLLSQTQ